MLPHSIEHETMLGQSVLHPSKAEDELLNGGSWIISTVKLM